MLKTFERAIQADRDVTIRYRDVNGNVTKRRIRPLEVQTTLHGDTVIRAICHKRGEARTFRLDRIANAKLSDNRNKFGQFVHRTKHGFRGHTILITHLYDMQTRAIEDRYGLTILDIERHTKRGTRNDFLTYLWLLHLLPDTDEFMF